METGVIDIGTLLFLPIPHLEAIMTQDASKVPAFVRSDPDALISELKKLGFAVGSGTHRYFGTLRLG